MSIAVKSGLPSLGSTEGAVITKDDISVTEETSPSASAGEDLPRGKSAYEVAKENGFNGTEAEWLASLKGATGAPGANGKDGTDGKTPYVGDNGNWYIGTDDTGKPSRGAKGDKGDTDISLGLTSASVGQAIKVKAIDESGKPTAWEAANMPSGGGSAVELDTTLSEAGKAADAKAVGDALAENQHLFDSAVFFDENTELLEWEFGGLYSNGSKFDSESCIRTKKIKVAVGTTFFLKELFAGNGETRVVFYDDSGAKLDSRNFYRATIDNVALFREISVTNDMDGAWCALSVEIDTEKYPRANYSIDDYVSIYFGGVRDNPYFKIAPNAEFNAETRRTVSDVMGGDMGRLRFLHVSDTHLGIDEWSQNAMHNGYNMLFGSMVETAKRLNCDFILHTGDVIAGSADIDDSTPWKQAMLHFKEVVKEAGMPIIVCRGNHDDNSVGTPSASKVIDNTWWNNNMNITLNEYCKDFVFPADNTGYYYYNIPSKKIRVVNINSEDLTDAERVSVGGQHYAVVSQNQLNWLDTDAFVVPDGWKIICVSHISCASGQPNMGISNGSDLMSIITAHKDDILAYVYGHTHMSVNYVDESTGIQFISTIPCGIKANSAYVQSGRNSSYPSDSAYASAPTGRFVFDVCKLVENRIERTRWGVQDDTFQA